jgi:hypothetical protein
MIHSWLHLRRRRRPGEAGQLRALEHVLDQMAERVARAELQAQRHADLAQRSEARALAAENALIRLQDNLDRLRRPALA